MLFLTLEWYQHPCWPHKMLRSTAEHFGTLWNVELAKEVRDLEGLHCKLYIIIMQVNLGSFKQWLVYKNAYCPSRPRHAAPCVLNAIIPQNWNVFVKNLLIASVGCQVIFDFEIESLNLWADVMCKSTLGFQMLLRWILYGLLAMGLNFKSFEPVVEMESNNLFQDEYLTFF